ncbi:MAG TPA: AsmA family protein [Candidatus Mailhella merdavium]|nr:AsmA family protein [Candidatus Mailhella merdavium]
MFRKILLGFLLIIVLVVAGGWMFLKTQGDVILEKFSQLVEKNTGKPLHMEGLPEIGIFPGISLTLGPSTWGEKEDDISVSFSRASIRVSASALLAGRMELTSLEADDLKVNCRFPAPAPESSPTASGTDGNAPAAPQKTASPLTEVSLEERINHMLGLAPDTAILNRASVALLWEDGRSCTFSNISLKLTNARPNATLGLESSADVAFRQTPGGVLRRAGLQLESNLGCKDGAVSAVVHKALIHPEEQMGFTEDASFSGGMAWTPGNNTLTLNNLESSLPGITFSASGTLSAPDMARLLAVAPRTLAEHILLKGSGGLQIRCKGSLHPLMLAAGFTPFQDKNALTALNADIALRLEGGLLTLEKLDGSLDGTSFSGSLEGSIEPPVLRGNLQLGEVVPARYLPAPGKEEKSTSIPRVTERKSESGATVLVIQPWPAVDLSLSVERVIWEKFLVENIQAKISGDQGTYHVNPLTFTAWDSQAKASIDAVLPAVSALASAGSSLRDTDLHLQLSADNINLRKIVESLPDNEKLRPEQVSGKGKINASLNFNASNFPGTLNGQGSISAAPLTLTLTELAGVSKDLKGFAALLGGRAQGIEKIEKLASSGTDFEKLLITFTSSKGIITVTDARCTSPELELSGKGTINLPGETLDLAGTLRVAGVASLPVSMKGPFTKPAYRLDMGRDLKKIDLSLQPGGKLEREISRGLEKLFK